MFNVKFTGNWPGELSHPTLHLLLAGPKLMTFLSSSDLYFIAGINIIHACPPVISTTNTILSAVHMQAYKPRTYTRQIAIYSDLTLDLFVFFFRLSNLFYY